MNQLNQIQEKLQSNVISDQELKTLRGKRGKVYRGGYNTINDNPEGNTGNTTAGNSSPTVVVSSTPQVTVAKFSKSRVF